jgi:hypothetical protein
MGPAKLPAIGAHMADRQSLPTETINAEVRSASHAN